MTVSEHFVGLIRTVAGSHIPGTERSSAVTSGHAGAEICIQEEHGGYWRIWSDMQPRRFGTVRPRVQIPGPRPKSNSENASPTYRVTG